MERLISFSMRKPLRAVRDGAHACVRTDGPAPFPAPWKSASSCQPGAGPADVMQTRPRWGELFNQGSCPPSPNPASIRCLPFHLGWGLLHGGCKDSRARWAWRRSVSGGKLPGWSRPFWIGRALELVGLSKSRTDAKGTEWQRAPFEGECGRRMSESTRKVQGGGES